MCIRDRPPVMSILGAFNIGGALTPSDAPTTQIQFADQISWTKSSHNLRGGFEFEFVRWPLTFADFLIGRAGCSPADTTCSPTNPGNTTGITSSAFNLCLFCVRSVASGIV